MSYIIHLKEHCMVKLKLLNHFSFKAHEAPIAHDTYFMKKMLIMRIGLARKKSN